MTLMFVRNELMLLVQSLTVGSSRSEQKRGMKVMNLGFVAQTLITRMGRKVNEYTNDG